MADRVHVRNDTVLGRYNGERHWIVLEDGRRTSPTLGADWGTADKILPIVTETIDNSTGPDTVTTLTKTLEATRELVVVTIRDKTAEELTAALEEIKDNSVAKMDADKALKALAEAIFRIKKGTDPAGAFDSPAAFKTWLRSMM